MRYGHFHKDGLSGYAYPTGDDPGSALKRMASRFGPWAGLVVLLIVLSIF